MRDQPCRLGTDRPHHLQGSAIDRSRPIQFRLDGRNVSGFAGDTVLSALLASGIDTIGQRDGAALALAHRHAPTISFAALAADRQRRLPMERTPATAGAEYITIAHKLRRNPLARLLGRGGRTLAIDLDRAEALARPWIGAPAEAGPEVDLVVVGGGVAGLSSALAGAKRGLRVALIEVTPVLGGYSRLFGTLEGEQTPDEQITRLAADVAKSDAITVLVNAEVFALRPGVVRLHQVEMVDGTPSGRVMEIKAPHVVLATGSLERLPVFPGNRLPGVTGALEAFELAHRYGIWAGASALVATSSSPAYRLAMLATDAGITVPRILDSRPHPQSRFIEFSKAYGMTQAAGTIIASAAPAPENRRGLVVAPKISLSSFIRSEPQLPVDRLVVSGGWQPDLTLWHMAGGQSAWSVANARLEPRNGPDGIALAGSAAGWLSRSACVASGGDAVDALLGRERRAVEEHLIDPIYETSDGPSPIGDTPDEAAPPAYLDGGWRHIERPRLKASRWPTWLPFAPAAPGWSLADTPQPLDIADIAAGVQLGAIPAASAGIVAQERVAMVVLESDNSDQTTYPPLALPPPYLRGRYPGAELWLVVPRETRALGVGALIYGDADETDPLKAIGVIVRTIGGKAVALVAGQQDQAASVREPGRAVGIRLAAPYREGMSLDA